MWRMIRRQSYSNDHHHKKPNSNNNYSRFFLFMGMGVVGSGSVLLWYNNSGSNGISNDKIVFCDEEKKKHRNGVLAVIGNTPLIKLESLSQLTGCEILAKCEHMNPGGSVKDRAALYIVEDAEQKGLISGNGGGTLVEGTGGNTGVALAMIAAAKGYGAVMCMPENIAQEKIDAMKNFGAKVVKCPPVPFTSEKHYFHKAARFAQVLGQGGYFTNQFENEANRRAHLEMTGPEIWSQTNGVVDGFCCSAGTGGTISGISEYLKSKNPDCSCFLIDPPGSALFDFINSSGTADDERTYVELVHGQPTTFIPRSEGSSITEGIGIGRVTRQIALAKKHIDGAIKVSDEELTAMAYHLKQKDGIFVGPSAALNCVGAVRLASHLGPGHTVVTVLCDGGAIYKSNFYNTQWMEDKGLGKAMQSASDIVSQMTFQM